MISDQLAFDEVHEAHEVCSFLVKKLRVLEIVNEGAPGGKLYRVASTR
jgi:hypothetical protein